MLPVTALPNIVIKTAMTYDAQTGRSEQKRPYNVPTSYQRRVVIYGKKYPASRDVTTDINFEFVGPISLARKYAYNKAYERLIAKLKDPSSFGATLTAERRETFGMITTILTSVLNAAKAARKGDVIAVLRALHFSPPKKVVRRSYPRKRGSKRRKYVNLTYYIMPNGRTVLKKAGNSWLLWSYGVSPLLGDVQRATETFIRAVPSLETYTASKTEKFEDVYRLHKDGTHIDKIWKGAVGVRIRTEAKCVNADLWLLNQLGLLNPVQFLNEAIPFSFVVDWCSNWSAVINSLTDLAGISLTNTVTTSMYRGSHSYYFLNYWQSLVIEDWVRTFTYMSRSVGALVAPSLQFRYERFEWQRALNAISLLVGFLPKTQK